MGGKIRYNLRMEPGALGPDMFPPRAAGGDARSAVGPALLPGVCPDFFLLKVFLGMNPAVFDALARIGVKGLLDRGVVVAITTQSLFDGTDLSLYKVGKECFTMGAIEGRDTTVEALVAKLMWALSPAGPLTWTRCGRSWRRISRGR